VARNQRRLRRQRIAQTVPQIPPGSRVLDVGCGDAELFRQLGSRLGHGIGIDPMLPGSIIGRRYWLLRGWFPDDLPTRRPFDVITMLGVLEELPPGRRAGLVATCCDWLVPGGRLVLTAPPEVLPQLPLARATQLQVGPGDLSVFLVDGAEAPTPDRMR
jgi:2-polyprenyl-3-methyl-5-hydroxy-6-metoxy-1,4-benzoquinol methylase